MVGWESQLSEAVAEKLTGASKSVPQFTVIFAGQVMPGLSVSLTVTLKVQLGPPLAVQTTVVTPLGKVEPEAGEALTASGLPHWSFATGRVKFTTAEHWPGAV